MRHRVVAALRAGYAALEIHLARLREVYIAGALACFVAAFALWYVFFLPAPAFPEGRIITVPAGASVQEMANQLAEDGVIRSPFTFTLLARLRGGQGSMKSGKYVFAKPVGVFRVEERVEDGAFGVTATRVLFVEGSTVADMARILKRAFPDFDDAAFLDEAAPLEGYLFPDTYSFYPDVTPDDVVLTLYQNFKDHAGTISDDIAAFDRPLTDDVIMASILEKEARTLAEKRMVAGILWNRIKLGMPLQVDAVFGYINDRKTYSPSLSDLKVDSPYNTYTNKGLPPGPIGNPGLASLLAAVTPATTTDLYYLTGRDGVMHYAQTFAQHKINRAKYLD